jgi:protein phosphatase
MAAAPSPRRRRRRVLAALAAVVLLGAAAVGAYLWVLSNWFVGVQETAAGERVTVFRGLDTSLLGMDLNRVADVTELPVADLTPAGASKVQRGIRADDAAHAERIVGMLREERLPLCPAVEDDPEPSTVSPTAPTPTSPSAAPDDGAAPTSAEPTPPAPTTSAPTSQRATATLEPGVDCREAQ